MARKTTRVDIPGNPDELLKLLGQVLKKHEADGANSPLKSLDMTLFASLLATASAANDASADLYRQAKIQTDIRDAAFGTIQTSGSELFVLSQIRNLLLAIYQENPRMLGDWGFDVIEGESSGGRKAAASKTAA